LINRDPYSRRAVAVAQAALCYGKRPIDDISNAVDVRKSAAAVLSKLEPLAFSAEVYDALREVMTSDDYWEARDAAYAALIRLAGAASVAVA